MEIRKWIKLYLLPNHFHCFKEYSNCIHSLLLCLFEVWGCGTAWENQSRKSINLFEKLAYLHTCTSWAVNKDFIEYFSIYSIELFCINSIAAIEYYTFFHAILYYFHGMLYYFCLKISLFLLHSYVYFIHISTSFIFLLHLHFYFIHISTSFIFLHSYFYFIRISTVFIFLLHSYFYCIHISTSFIFLLRLFIFSITHILFIFLVIFSLHNIKHLQILTNSLITEYYNKKHVLNVCVYILLLTSFPRVLQSDDLVR